MINVLSRLAAVAAIAGAIGSSAVAAESLTFPVATWGSPNHINVRSFVGKLEEVVARESGGRITVKHYPSGQLAQDADMPVAVPTGKVKFGWVTLQGWSGVVPDVKIADAPAGLTMAQMAAATDAADGLKAVLGRQFEAKGAKLLAVTDLGPTVVVSQEQVLEPADLEGKKLRVYSEGTAELGRALGAAPVKLPFADVYTALQRGTIDGAITGFQGVESQKMYEVAKYLLIPASFTGTGYQGWVANLGWWQGLSDGDRDLLAKAIREAELYAREQIIEDRKSLAEHYRSKGMTVSELTPDMPAYAKWVTATRPLMEKAEATLSAEIVAPIKEQQASAH